MEVGQLVFVSPVHSLRFGGRWGKIMRIDPTLQMPFILVFKESGIEYQFSRNELMTEEDYLTYLSQHREALTIDRKVVRLNIPYTVHDSYLYDTSGGVYNIHELLPITRCRSCNCDTTGLMTEFCEDCEYPVPARG